MQLNILAFVLAGGKGTRLYPLTKERAKPAVPFGGKYRIVDFVMSNLINSRIYSIYVLIQFRSQSLLQHLTDGWLLGGVLKHQFIIPVPAQMRSPGEAWYRGTADAIAQNINLIEQSYPDLVLIFGADHIYRMNIRDMVEFHVRKGATVTVSALPVDRKHASEFGVVEATDEGRIVGFHEKRSDAPTIPGDSSRVHASMGNYIFSTATLLKAIEEDQRIESSSHDFGTDILPRLIRDEAVYAYDFGQNSIPDEPPDKAAYWRDVGTLDAYYEANMDLRSIDPELNLYNRQWPLRTASYPDPPAKLAFNEDGRRGEAIDSVLSGGCIISGGRVQDSVLGRGVFVHSNALVDGCIIFDNCDIGRRARIRRTILEKNVKIPPDAVIGYDLEADRKRYHVTESGIVVVEGQHSHINIGTMTVTDQAYPPLREDPY